MTGAEVQTSLKRAIDKGVPIFNAGHHDQRCDLYISRLPNISSAGIAGADEHTMTMVERTLTNAQNTHDMTDRGWVLHRGMDDSMVRIGKMTMPNSTATPN